MPAEDNKRIAKNTLFLYIRKIIGIVIAFYSSRLLLQALGVNDFGLYGLIGSIVALFSSLRGLFSSSIQRFINVAKGRNEADTINKIFSIGVEIHIYISILFFVVVEIAGILLIPKLNIDESMIVAAQWVLQFSILATITTIMTVPYDAVIIANERFDAYALFAIIESILRLLIIFLLYISDGSRVIFYSALIFIVSLVVRSMNMFYCRRHFGEVTKYHKTKDKVLFKEMTHFAGWQFFGNTGYAVSTSGINFLLNFYGGTVANAARAIAYQIMNMVLQFMNDINISFQPRIMIKYAESNYDGFQRLLFICTKATFGICSLIACPIIVFTPSLLKLWLKVVPEYSIEFVRLIMIYIIIRSVHTTFDMFFKTVGSLKYYQICEFVMLMLNIPIAWILLSFGFPLSSAFISMMILEVLNLVIIAFIAKQKQNFGLLRYCSDIVVRVFLCLAAFYFIGFVIDYFFQSNSENYIITFSKYILYEILMILVIIGLLFSRNEFVQIYNLIKR